MLGDLTEKVQSSQNKFEELVAKIPGYAGYKKKEQRREADKLLRLYVARMYDEQLKRLNGIQLTLTNQGKLKAMMTMERASIKLQLLIDRIKTASYGYAGLFDAVKVDEAALDRMYDFDEQMLAGVDTVKDLLDQLEAAANQDEDAGSLSGELVSLVEGLNTGFSQRQDIILQ